jgi:hypothetical protein
VPIAAPPSLSLLTNRNSTHPRVLPTNQGVVPHVARRERQSVTAMVVAATVRSGRCTRRYVLNVAKRHRCHSSHAEISRSIAAIVTARREHPGRKDRYNYTIDWNIPPVYCIIGKTNAFHLYRCQADSLISPVLAIKYTSSHSTGRLAAPRGLELFFEKS